MGYLLVGGICLFIGCVLGIFLTAMCIAGKTADKQAEKYVSKALGDPK